MNALKPSTKLLVKLGSLIVHYEEAVSADGNPFDWTVIDSLREDPEVKEWIKSMNELGMLPVKRK